MLIPRYWHKATEAIERNQKMIHVTRWGWSNESVEDAKNNAVQRCRQAVLEKPFKRSEADKEYGDHERPIKEEIIYARDDPNAMIITRNRYGAHCLNSDTLAILDIDLEEHRLPVKQRNVVFLGAIASVPVLHHTTDFGWLFSIVLMTIIYNLVLIPILDGLWKWCTPAPDVKKYNEIKTWISQDPEQKRNAKIYKTPAGLRVILTHRVYAMNEELWDIMQSLGCDPLYIHLCKMQRCCRARLTPKPWRMIHSPPLGRMPKNAADQPAWIHHYENYRVLYSACKWIGDEGSGIVDPALDHAIGYHDSVAQVHSDRPVA